MPTPDALIIGGGLIGCSLARELARSGCEVTVLESGRVGRAASAAAAGLLSPTIAAAVFGPLADLAFQSAALYEGWIDELRQAGANDVGYRRFGLIEVFPDAVAVGALREGLKDHARPGRRALWLSPEELRHREPALTATIAGAAFYPDDALVSPGPLAEQVARAAELAGARINEREPVIELVRKGDRIVAVQTASQRFEPGVVVLAAGAWTGALAGLVGLSLPTRPVKGQLLSADCRVSPVHTPFYVGEAVFVPRPDGSLMVGVTLEEGAGFDDQPTLEGIHSILQRAIALVPAIATLHLAHAWAGLRPATPDDLPYMGPVPGLKNFWLSAGHFRKGILLAPLCARLMAQSILADKLCQELATFRPGR